MLVLDKVKKLAEGLGLRERDEEGADQSFDKCSTEGNDVCVFSVAVCNSPPFDLPFYDDYV